MGGLGLTQRQAISLTSSIKSVLMFSFLCPHACGGGSHQAPVNMCGAEIKATAKPPPSPECLFLGKSETDGPTLGLLSDL